MHMHRKHGPQPSAMDLYRLLRRVLQNQAHLDRRLTAIGTRLDLVYWIVRKKEPTSRRIPDRMTVLFAAPTKE